MAHGRSRAGRTQYGPRSQWTAAHLDAFLREYPAGAVERVAFFLMLYLGLDPKQITTFKPSDLPNAGLAGKHPELLAELKMYRAPRVPYVWQALGMSNTIKLIRLVLDAAASTVGAPTCTPGSLSTLRAMRMPDTLARLV